jgi:hypothetical protein
MSDYGPRRTVAQDVAELRLSVAAASEAGSARGGGGGGSEYLTSRSDDAESRARARAKGPMRASPPAGAPSLDLAGGSRRAHAMLLEGARRDEAGVALGGGGGSGSVGPSVVAPVGASGGGGATECPHCSGRSGDRRQMAMHRQYGCPFVVAREGGGRALNTVTSSKSVLTAGASDDWQRSLWNTVAAAENAAAPAEYDPLTGRCVGRGGGGARGRVRVRRRSLSCECPVGEY